MMNVHKNQVESGSESSPMLIRAVDSWSFWSLIGLSIQTHLENFEKIRSEQFWFLTIQKLLKISEFH